MRYLANHHLLPFRSFLLPVTLALDMTPGLEIIS
jgi:hypothetical protein